MPNPNLFGTYSKKAPNTLNNAGAPAYKLSAKKALAQYAVTGCFYGTFYASALDQLNNVKILLDEINDAEFVAKLAVYSRVNGYMKDMPAFLCAWLTAKNVDLLKRIFFTVIDNGNMLRKYVQFVRSGVFDRKSFGTAPKRLIRTFLTERDENLLFKDSIGKNPSISDIIKMVHPVPKDKRQEAFFGYLIGKDADLNLLPEDVQVYESFKQDTSLPLPNIDFRFLTSLDLDKHHWIQIARKAPWHMTRMNLNTFERHGVYEDKNIIEIIASKLANKDLIKKNKVFPYQILTTYYNLNPNIPDSIKYALEDAIQHSLDNIPEFGDVSIAICTDVSYSMSSPVTGYQGGRVSSRTRCVDVAAVFTSAIMARHDQVIFVPFNHMILKSVINKVNNRNNVFQNASIISQALSGGTNCSKPIQYLSELKKKIDIVIMISDNESWMDARQLNRYKQTALMQSWDRIKNRNPNAKLICWDIVPNQTTQAYSRSDILNIGGFSDNVFDIIKMFLDGELNQNWTKVIDTIQI